MPEVATCARCHGLGWVCSAIGLPGDGYCCGSSSGCPSRDGCPACTRPGECGGNGLAPAWIEPGCELPALHLWASHHLDRQEACRMVEVRLRELETAIAAAQAARAAREIATPAALAELRDLGPAGTRAQVTLGGQLYAVHFEDGRIVLEQPPTQPEDPCP